MPTLQKRCKLLFSMGSVCGSVGGAVASDPRGSRFESSQLTKLLYRTLVYCQLYCKDENNEKEVGNGPFIIKLLFFSGPFSSSFSLFMSFQYSKQC